MFLTFGDYQRAKKRAHPEFRCPRCERWPRLCETRAQRSLSVRMWVRSSNLGPVTDRNDPLDWLDGESRLADWRASNRRSVHRN